VEKIRTEIHLYRTRDAMLKTDSGSTADVVLAPTEPSTQWIRSFNFFLLLFGICVVRPPYAFFISFQSPDYYGVLRLQM
jgi:hypothetical protein